MYDKLKKTFSDTCSVFQKTRMIVHADELFEIMLIFRFETKTGFCL